MSAFMEKFKIYVDRLKNGNSEKFNETVEPAFLDIHEEELAFEENVQIKGEAYLADDHLVAHFSIETSAYLPCSICNEAVRIPLSIKDSYNTTPLTEIHSGIHDLTNEIREAVLLQVPLFTECNGGKCPERENMKKFFTPSPQADQPQGQSPTVHFPFADLN